MPAEPALTNEWAKNIYIQRPFELESLSNRRLRPLVLIAMAQGLGLACFDRLFHGALAASKFPDDLLRRDWANFSIFQIPEN